MWISATTSSLHALDQATPGISTAVGTKEVATMVVSKRFIAVPSSRHRRRAWLRYPFVLRTAWSEQMALKPTDNRWHRVLATPSKSQALKGHQAVSLALGQVCVPRVKSDQHFAHKSKPADRILGRVAGCRQNFQLYKPFAKNFRHRLANVPSHIGIHHR